MSIVDRASYKDAKMVVEYLLPERFARKELLEFLVNAIIYSDGLKSDNWNLNLDKNGKFIRFNVGHAYCVQISAGEILILGLREKLNEDLTGRNLEIEFRGHQSSKRISNRTLQNVPDCLAKVPDSVACIVAPQNIARTLPYLEAANRHFILYATNNTRLLVQMENAHSTGFIEYLSRFSSRHVPNPIYAISKEDTAEEESEVSQNAEKFLEDVIISDDFMEGDVRQITVKSYGRSAAARKKCIEHYGTTCIICGFNFEKTYGPLGRDYIQIHHLDPLSEIQESCQVDPVNDLRPVCPNCHAIIHRENPPLTIEQVKDLLATYA
jgi:hypothetical protein